MAWATPHFSAAACSNSATWEPMMKFCAEKTPSTALSSSGPMARYSRERSRLGTLRGGASGLSFLSPTLVMLASPTTQPLTPEMHLSSHWKTLIGDVAPFLCQPPFRPGHETGRRVNFL